MSRELFVQAAETVETLALTSGQATSTTQTLPEVGSPHDRPNVGPRVTGSFWRCLDSRFWIADFSSKIDHDHVSLFNLHGYMTDDFETDKGIGCGSDRSIFRRSFHKEVIQWN
jgi:hypothetical protein